MSPQPPLNVSPPPSASLRDGPAGLPIVSLGAFPTPVHRLKHLGKALHHDSLWVKRDDVSGDPYGGNKIRKLELLLGQALCRGATAVATVGALGSNHVLATAVCASRVGLGSTAVTFPRPMSRAVIRTVLATATQGCRLIHLPSPALVPLAVATLRGTASLRGERLCWIAGGGSSALGTVGYVLAALELAEQVRAGELPEPAWLYVALGSGGTAAGLLAGLRIAGLGTRVRAVRVVPAMIIGARRTAALANAALELLAAAGWAHGAAPLRAADVEVIGDQLGDGYGHSTRASSAAVRLLRDAEQLACEETYTGKALAALVTDLGSGRIAPGDAALFWNTYSSRDIEALIAPGAHTGLPAAVRRALPWV